MKLTNYLRFQAGESDYLFHGLTGNIVSLDEGAKDFVHYAEQNGVRVGDTIHLTDLGEQYTDIIEELVALEILQNEEDELIFSKTPSAPIKTDHMPVKTLVMHLVNECNLRCTYCYADGGEYGAPKKVMTKEVASEAVDFLIEKSYDEPSVTIVLFGGEPFLNWGVLRHIVEYSQEKAKEFNKTIHYSVTTNGTLLTEKQMEFLSNYSIGVSVSMDGTKEAHDKNRPLVGGQGSYDRVEKNVSKLMSIHQTAPVGTRVTVAKGYEEIEKSLTHLLSKGFYEVGFAPVTESNMNLALDEEDLKRMLDQFREIAEDYVQHALRNEYYGFSNLTNVLRELHTGTNKAYGCGAGLGFFAVSPEGGLYLCHRFNEDERFKLGDIYNGIEREKQRDMLNELHVDRKQPCQTCSLKHICAGGCYYEAMERQGDFRSPNAHYCEWMHEWITIGLNVYVRIQEGNPQFLDRITGNKERCTTS